MSNVMAALFSAGHDMSLRFWVASDGISYRRGLCSLFVRRYRANARASKVERQRKVHAFLCFHTPLVKRQYWQKSPEGQGCAQKLMQIRLSLRTKKLPWAAHVLGMSVFFRHQKNYRKIENNPCLPRKFHTFAADY